MNTALRKEALSETYQDLDQLIWKAVHKYWFFYGGELEELKAEANLLFINAFDSFQESRGVKITTWVYNQVFNRLRLAWSRQYSVETRTMPEDLEIALSPTRIQRWEFWEELGADAQTMARALMDGAEGLTDKDLEKGFSVCQARKDIKLYFRKVGWTHRRIKETIQEIKGIINA